MTAAELIELLKTFDPELPIYIYNQDSSADEEVWEVKVREQERMGHIGWHLPKRVSIL